MLSPEKFQWSNDSGADFNNVFDEWIDTVPWLSGDMVNWVSQVFRVEVSGVSGTSSHHLIAGHLARYLG